ncbi:MAG: PEP/pyruvate-binding domain-containing protein [Lachnospiraceae bacterium]|nr:PEP/pyruvate-binding domain-containing protein [Lachnospiraceae bacterium]
MAAFDPICSGIAEFDQAIDSIRLGDNVVFRVSDLSEFHLFLDPYLTRAVEDKRNIIYVRFASHPPLVEQERYPEIKTVQIPLSHRFETFTVDVHNLIEEEGRDAFYVFDCLSELQTAWATDLMMGNFFQVTCPFLFQLDTVAFFPIIRGKHSLQAIAKIRNTTQLFFDVYSADPVHAQTASRVYVRPEKVWNRFSETMFLPHVYEREEQHFRPLLDGVEASSFYRILNAYQRPGSEQNVDALERFFDLAKISHEHGLDTTEFCNTMCNIMMSRDEQMRLMIRNYFTAADYFEVHSKMVGSGMIGGKACGMLLARKILETDAPEIAEYLEPHDSFYVGSDVFYTYIVENHFWDLKIAQRKSENYFELAEPLRQKLLEGAFSRDMEDQFRLLLDYYGQDPYIVRSSSILEDGFGNAFAGKYDSVFCANQGSMEERLEELEQAIRTVYASTMSLSALDYRRRRGLDRRDEQMALLVQRVSGSYYGPYFMPCAAGVGYSSSPYRFLRSCDTSQGMLRLVMGLGTSAVDRTEGSYPRLVSLDQPEVHYASTSRERHRFSQRKIELISRESREIEQMDPLKIREILPAWLVDRLYEHDGDTETQLRERGERREVLFVSCRGLARDKAMMELFRKLLRTIQNVYRYPVDIEFTINLSQRKEYVINLLQCRPLQTYSALGNTQGAEDAGMPDLTDRIRPEQMLFHCRHTTMGPSQSRKLDYIVYVDPIAYYEMPYVQKNDIARAIGKVNWYFRNRKQQLLLMVPGRIGTSSPELGVPVTFHEISEFCGICEIAESRAGYSPELSYGSHMFQDLVEMEILYTAIFESEQTLAFLPELQSKLPNILGELFPELKNLESILRLTDVSSKECYIQYDMLKEEVVCGFADCAAGE